MRQKVTPLIKNKHIHDLFFPLSLLFKELICQLTCVLFNDFSENTLAETLHKENFTSSEPLLLKSSEGKRSTPDIGDYQNGYHE
jgi:hypothetical protein